MNPRRFTLGLRAMLFATTTAAALAAALFPTTARAVIVNSGNLGSVVMSAGTLTIDGSNVNIASGINASSGIINVNQISNGNGPFQFCGNVQAALDDGNLNGTVSVEDTAEVHFVTPFFTNANTTPGKLVLDASGAISGNGSNLTFTVDPTAELYVGGPNPGFAVPEPDTPLLLLLATGLILFAPRSLWIRRH